MTAFHRRGAVRAGPNFLWHLAAFVVDDIVGGRLSAMIFESYGLSFTPLER